MIARRIDNNETEVQSLKFNKDLWTLNTAKNWVRENEFAANDADITTMEDQEMELKQIT